VTEVGSRVLLAAAALFGIGAVLILLIGLVKRNAAATRRLWIAYLCELGIVAAVLVPAYLGPRAFLLAALALGLLSAWELVRTTTLSGQVSHRPTVLLGTGALLLAASGLETQGFYLVFALTAAFALASPLWRARASASGAFSLQSGTLLGVVYPGLALGHALLILRVPEGFGLLAFLYVLLEINDSFAVLLGNLLGGPKPWPVLSPRKTLGGSIGGLVCTIAAAVPLGL
jgi:phosphatidate cytidylyltransferase